MVESSEKARLAQLRSAIDRAAQLYYTPGCESPINDDEYEGMMSELRAICPGDPRLTRVGTPYSPADMRDKRSHTIPMGSLNNTDDGINGFADWYDKTLALLDVENAVINVSLKMDGNSIALIYDKGILTEAISRGDGEIGESLTANAVKWTGVPTVLPVPFTGTVRGEAILYKAEFGQLKEQDSTLTNPRNVGSGIIGRIDGTQNELIRFVAFNCIDQRVEFPSLTAKFKTLEKLGFSPVQYVALTGEHDEVVEKMKAHFTDIESKRDSLAFEIDGLVVMIDNVEMQKRITKDRKDALRPKYGRAVKFATQKAMTRVTGVTITVGHTGAIIPTAILEPVFVGGVTVTNVLLNNWNADSENPSAAHVAIGDVVEVARQGDVIPKIVRVVLEADDRQPIEEPTTCPVCGAPTTRTVRDKEGAVTLCSGSDCPAQSIGKVKHYIRDAGIMGVGDGVLKALTDELVQTPADLYRLTAEQLVDLSIGESKSGTPIRLGDSRTTALLQEIEKSKVLPLCHFLGALGVPLLGKRRAEIVANEMGLTTLDDWLDTEKLTLIPGDTMRTTITDGLNKAWPIIEDLLGVGVTVQPHTQAQQPATNAVSEDDGPKTINGSTFCFTGTRDFLDEVVARGGIIKSGVSKGLNYLVQKDATSSSNKTKKAEEYGTKILSIDCLRRILDGEQELP
jgi:DNA ligase (NAD+)